MKLQNFRFFETHPCYCPTPPSTYSVMAAHRLSIPPNGSSSEERTPDQKAVEDIRRVAAEVLADLLEGVLLRGISKKAARRRGKREPTLEALDKAEQQRKKLRVRK